MSEAQHSEMLTARREVRALARAAEAERRISGFVEPWLPVGRSCDEWRALSVEAAKKAGQRERMYLKHVLGEAHPWRLADVAQVLAELEWVGPLFKEAPIFKVYYNKTEALMSTLEKEHYGLEFALALHYDMHLTIPAILKIVQAGCKRFITNEEHPLGSFESKELLFDPFHKAQGRSAGKYKSIKVPRIAPPGHRLTIIIRELEARIGIDSAEDGRMALRSLAVVVQELVMEDPGRYDMPPLPDFLGGRLEIPFFISFDGTGFGQLGINTIAVGNPYTPQSAQLLRIIGVGNCSDDKGGTTRLLGTNLTIANELIRKHHRSELTCFDCPTTEGETSVKLHPYHILDIAALRCVPCIH
jgi:hypothetical protein